MKVLHIRTSPFLGSPEKLILSQVVELKGRVDSHLAIIPDGLNQDFYSEAQSRDIPVSRVQRVSDLKKLCQQNNFDVIVSHDYKSNFFAWRVKNASKRIAVFHGRTRHNLKSRFYEWIDSSILQTMDAVVAVSEATQSQIQYLKTPVHVIHNACDWTHASSLPKNEEYKSVTFMTAGRLSAEKAHSRLIDAFHKLHASFPNTKLIIAGEGEERPRLTQKIKDLQCEESVKLLGFVSDMKQVYENSDVFVLPSDREGLPLVLLEAGTYGKPVITTRVGGVEEVISHGETGLLIPPQQTNALRDAMAAMAESKERRIELGTALQKKIETDFSIEAYANKYFELYQRVISSSMLWISWEKHRRTREMAKAFNCELVEITSQSPRWRKYPGLLWKTIRVVLKHKPNTLFVQSPSVILAFMMGWLKKALAVQLVVDAHNESVIPYNYSSALYQWVIRKIHQWADVVIVTNSALEKVVLKNGGKPFVLPDSIPKLDSSLRKSQDPYALFICTFCPDEPYAEVIEAAKDLSPGTFLRVTGNYKKADPKLIKNAPKNVQFLGFVSEEDYLKNLSQADVVVDLTNMEDCLVCGAYEAVSVERPLVTSDTKALRHYFNQGTLFTKHNPKDIAHTINAAFLNKSILHDEMVTLKEKLNTEWNIKKENLMDRLKGAA